MLDGTEYLECDCGSFEHTLRFILDLDENEIRHPYPTIYTEISLNHYILWYKRILIGIKYIFGYPSGPVYDSWMISTKDDSDKRMIAMIQKLQKRVKEIEEDKVLNIESF